MKIIGGEREVNNRSVFSYLTDSGRSSLRLILRRMPKGVKMLLPDYLCKTIVKVVVDEGIPFGFYEVNNDLTCTVPKGRFDILYVINYFGQKNRLIDAVKNKKLFVIEDCAFMPHFEKPAHIERWAGFNTFRKVSHLSDGSIIKSTMKLSNTLIKKKEARFAAHKYTAKKVKFDYIHSGSCCEEEYLKIFKKAERLLDKQRNIYTISSHSLFHLFDFYRNLSKEYAIRKSNFNFLNRYLKEIGLPLRPEHHCFYVINVADRDALREYLFKHKIFLPFHWPKIDGIGNNLYNRVLSIPLDSRYTKKDMLRVAQLIKKFYSKSKRKKNR